MTRKIDETLAAILKKYGEGAGAVWDCHGTWVAYHAAIERIAAKADIVFDPPTIIEANGAAGVVSICVTGRIGDNEDYKTEWSFGEASPKNNKNAYPYAMAEKRAKDRVVLKLIGLHGLVYSEEESDDFKVNQTNVPKEPSPAPATAPAYEPPTESEERICSVLMDDLRKAKSPDDINAWKKDKAKTKLFHELPSPLRHKVQAFATERLRAVQDLMMAG